MATKADFTEAEWKSLQQGVTGSAMLVSLADRDFTDTFGEVGALTKYLQGQQVAASTDLLRGVASTHSTGFGLFTSPEHLRTETMTALQSAVSTLGTKAPEEVDGYRGLVLGASEAVAAAKGGGTSAVETETLTAIRQALGA
jgi:hypothetical protein